MGITPTSPAPRRPRTLVLGVTGLPAAGKSMVAGMFEDLGAARADADALAHAALDRPAVARGVGRLLGREVMGTGGRVDRAAVAARVFGRGREEALAGLTALVHPVVHRDLRAAVAAARRAGARAVVLDVPLLFEAGVDGMCDATVFVDAPREVRLRRARARGWSASELRAREARQAPAAERRRRADFVLRNGKGRAAARLAVRGIWDRMLGGPPAGAARRS